MERRFQAPVKVIWKKEDRCDRILDHVYINGEWTNLKMIKQGIAWHYKQYSKDQELASAEIDARKKQLGLWSEKSPLAPWEWRKGNRNQNAKTKPKKVVPTKEGLDFIRIFCNLLSLI